MGRGDFLAGDPAIYWAGHSADVLLRVYTKCIAGQQDQAKKRIEDATQPQEPDRPASHEDGESTDGQPRG